MTKPYAILKGKRLLLLASLTMGGCTIGVQPHPVGTTVAQPAPPGAYQPYPGSTNVLTTSPIVGSPSWHKDVDDLTGQVKSLSERIESSEEAQNKARADIEQRLSLLEGEINELRGVLEISRRNYKSLKETLFSARQEGQAANQPPLMMVAPVPMVQAPVTSVPLAPNPMMGGVPMRPATGMTMAQVPPGPVSAPVVIEVNPPTRGPSSATMQPPSNPDGRSSLPGNAKEAYEAAFLKLRSGQYQSSLEAFNRFLKWYPKDDLADNAQYWIGELHYVQKDYPSALQAFNTVLVDWPESSKVPACLLKIGFAFYELGDMEHARASLTRLIADHPTSNAVSMAKQRLDMIDQKGGTP